MNTAPLPVTCELCGWSTCRGDCEITDPVVLAVLAEGAAFAAEVAKYEHAPDDEDEGGEEHDARTAYTRRAL